MYEIREEKSENIVLNYLLFKTFELNQTKQLCNMENITFQESQEFWNLFKCCSWVSIYGDQTAQAEFKKRKKHKNGNQPNIPVQKWTQEIAS